MASPYKKASCLFGLVPFENIYLKLTPRTFVAVKRGDASPETLFPRLVEAFGSTASCMGFELPGIRRDDSRQPRHCKDVCPRFLPRSAWIFARTAQILYPQLAD